MLGTETVQVRRRGDRTKTNDPAPASDPVPVEGCLIAPAGGTETIGTDRTAGTGAVSVTMPLTVGIDHSCELQIRGQWYRIVGDAVAFINEDPDLSGYQLTCVRGAGG